MCWNTVRVWCDFGFIPLRAVLISHPNTVRGATGQTPTLVSLTSSREKFNYPFWGKSIRESEQFTVISISWPESMQCFWVTTGEDMAQEIILIDMLIATTYATKYMISADNLRHRMNFSLEKYRNIRTGATTWRCQRIDTNYHLQSINLFVLPSPSVNHFLKLNHNS